MAELFDELIEIGMDAFNPFQPEVMDIYALKKQYHGRLSFHGGMSIQRVLPFGTTSEVRQETRRLIEAGHQVAALPPQRFLPTCHRRIWWQ